MPTIAKKQLAEYEQLRRDRDNGRLLTPDGLRFICEANKLDPEVESLYNVTVVDVNTIRYAGKRSARYTKAGLVKGQKNAFKKAIVTLKEGDTIDFYSNI